MAASPDPSRPAAPSRPTVESAIALGAGLAASALVLALPATSPAEALPTLLVPWLLLLAGAIARAWRTTAFVRRCLLALGAGQLTALALSAAALALEHATGSALLHTASQLLFGATFALLVPLAAGYPGPRAPRWSLLAAVPLLLPILAGLAAPTPAVLGGAELGPVAPLLPAALAAWGASIFALPIVATLVAVVRWIRGDADVRPALGWPLAALAALAAVVALGAITPEESRIVTDALFLVSAPLLPVGLVAGAREAQATDPERIRRDLADIAARVNAIGARLERPRPASEPAPGLAALSDRERDVLARIAQGRSNSAIARELHLSVSAVEKHTSAVFAKLGIEASPGVHRRVAAATAWLRAGEG